MRLGLALITSGVIGGIGACGGSDSGGDVLANPGNGAEAGQPDSGRPNDDSGSGGTDGGADGPIAAVDSLPANRDRLFATYGTCDAWKKLTPSAQDVFLTLTARLQGSKLGADGSSMLFHVKKLYRVAGGQNATSTDPGSCGGGEYNRMIMSMDVTLHDALVAANVHKGQPNGAKPDIEDVAVGAGSTWRESQDLGGPHTPFDISDETEHGGPRGQVQFFKDVTSAAAKSPLGRLELTTLVDPNAIEFDQDYDCFHNSNPRCDYTTYAANCILGPSKSGTDLYVAKYGNIVSTWLPADCAGK